MSLLASCREIKGRGGLDTIGVAWGEASVQRFRDELQAYLPEEVATINDFTHPTVRSPLTL
jgi:hypothetical protein